MNSETFDGSFKIFMEPEYNNPGTRPSDMSRRGLGDDPCTLEMFSTEIDIVKEDLLNLEKLYARMQESNDEIRTAMTAATVREIRTRIVMDLDHIFKLAKQINKKYDGLVRANAAQRKAAGSGPGSSDDQFRASLISQLVESLQSLMRRFQSLRTQMETEHRQQIEAKYLAITKEKATAEAIDNLISSEVSPESPLHQAMLEFGRAAVMDAVAEIQERRDTMKEARRNLMALHQIFLGIATPVTAAAAPSEGGNRGGGLPSPVENFPAAAAAAPVAGAFGGGNKGGPGGLNDFERETRRQSYVAIGIAIVLVIVLVYTVLKVESNLDAGVIYL
ncbi:hypothetical protein ACS0TY_031247 [Phlomoides rotata]